MILHQLTLLAFIATVTYLIYLAIFQGAIQFVDIEVLEHLNAEADFHGGN